MTCPAATEDMGDTPVMTALSDNGMNKPTSRHVPSPQVQRRQNNAETCHVRQTGERCASEVPGGVATSSRRYMSSDNVRSGSGVHTWGAEDGWQRVMNEALTPTASDGVG